MMRTGPSSKDISGDAERRCRASFSHSRTTIPPSDFRAFHHESPSKLAGPLRSDSSTNHKSDILLSLVDCNMYWSCRPRCDRALHVRTSANDTLAAVLLDQAEQLAWIRQPVFVGPRRNGQDQAKAVPGIGKILMTRASWHLFEPPPILNARESIWPRDSAMSDGTDRKLPAWNQTLA